MGSSCDDALLSLGYTSGYAEDFRREYKKALLDFGIKLAAAHGNTARHLVTIRSPAPPRNDAIAFVLESRESLDQLLACLKELERRLYT
jgi:hypothetical protein